MYDVEGFFDLFFTLGLSRVLWLDDEGRRTYECQTYCNVRVLVDWLTQTNRCELKMKVM